MADENIEHVNIVFPNEDDISLYPSAERLVATAIKRTAEGEAKEYVNLNVILTGDDLLRHLKNQFLGIDEPTDVLAFDLRDTDDGIIEGDIYISLDRVKDQANSAGVTWENELARLVVHGFLHLCGYDHDDEDQLNSMSARGEKYIEVI